MTTKFPAADATAFYVGSYSRLGPRQLLGPFRKRADAELCVPRVAQVSQHLEEMPAPSDLIILEVGATMRWLLRQGELKGLFPRGITDPFRLQADVVQYWRSEHEVGVVRWVAFSEAEPSCVVGRGQLELRDRSGDVEELVRAQVTRQDPVLAQYVKTYTSDLTPREAPANQQRKILEMRALQLDVGMVAIDPRDGLGKALTYWSRHRPDGEAQFVVTYSFDRWSPTQNTEVAGDHAIFRMLDVYGFDVNLRSDTKGAPPLPLPASFVGKPQPSASRPVDNQDSLFPMEF